MNRLILIGNGFDLAHGLKTGYVDFIKWYIKDQLTKFIQHQPYDDQLILIVATEMYPGNHSLNLIDKWVEECYQDGFDLNKLGEGMRGFDQAQNNVILYPFGISPTSKFLRALVEQCSLKRWVDVEGVFYERLSYILELKSKNSLKEELLNDLNRDMRVLIERLHNYLSSLEKPPIIKEYAQILSSAVRIVDLDSQTMKRLQSFVINDPDPGATQILNFNYTATIEQYVPSQFKNSPRNFSINYIHGELNNAKNPIVFGFGDELDERYLQMEREKAKGYFNHIKSFWYFRTSHYRELVRFIDNSEYQVIVLGHSCGLSDRTMLHMILEHVNCKSVKIYYHGDEDENNYTDITYEIARHFKNKSVMRDRIVSLDRSEPMPQFEA